MAITTIQLKRGLFENLPTLSVAELAFTTDTKQVFLGDGTQNLQVALSTDVAASLVSAKAYTDSAIGTLDSKIQGDIATAVGSIDLVVPVVTATADGLMAKEDKVIIDRLVGKEEDWDAKETEAGAQAKADAALVEAKQYADGVVSDLVDGAPESLNTINELAAAIQSLEQEDVDGLIAALAGKASAEHTHAATDVIEDATHRFVTDVEKGEWNDKAEQADIDTAVAAAKGELEGTISTLAGRVTALESVTVIDGGTF